MDEASRKSEQKHNSQDAILRLNLNYSVETDQDCTAMFIHSRSHHFSPIENCCSRSLYQGATEVRASSAESHSRDSLRLLRFENRFFKPSCDPNKDP